MSADHDAVSDSRTEPTFIVRRGDDTVERLESFAPPVPLPGRNPLAG